MIKPDFQGGSIANLMASLTVGLGGEHDYPELNNLAAAEIQPYKNVVLLIVDGLGDLWFQEHGQDWFMNSKRRASMTSVFPSTTAAAITTYITGSAPQQHGVTGWHMYLREMGSVISVLPGTPRFGGTDYMQSKINVRELLGNVPFPDRIARDSWMLSPDNIANSPYNRAHQGAASIRSYQKMNDMFSQLTQMIKKNDKRQFIYAYWPELDHIGHEQGMGSKAAIKHAQDIDKRMKQLAKDIAGTNTLVIVTADHGQMDVKQENELCINDHPELQECLLMPLCGERRAAYAYVRDDKKEQFESMIKEQFSHALDCFSSQQWLDEGWFGLGEPHAELVNRIGTHVLIAKDDYYVKDWLPQEKRYSHIGMHGGVSEAEMYVPLILIDA